MADETLATSGISHAVEHLALAGIGDRPYLWNGMVDATFTRFVVSGEPSEVVEHLAAVCDGLASLPLDRLETELRVLLTESSGRRFGMQSIDLFQRYGAQSFGLLGMNELGLRRLSADEVEAWAASRFTTSNAALWLSGPVPKSLRLDLPDGEAPLPPSAQTVLPGLPGCVPGVPTGASMSVVCAPARGVGTGMRIMRNRAHERLRRELGITYTVDSVALELGPDAHVVQVFADAAEGHSQAVRDDLAAITTDLAEHGPRETEVSDELARAERAWAEEDAVMGWLEAAIRSSLWRSEQIPPDEAMEAWRALKPESVGIALSEVLSTSLLLCAPDLPAAADWPYVSEWSADVIEGTELVPSPGSPERGMLRIGPDGLTLLPDPKHPITILFDEAVALQRWENGDRLLTSPSGHRIAAIATNWWGGEALPEYLDQHVATDVAIDMGPGETRTPPTGAGDTTGQGPPPAPPPPQVDPGAAPGRGRRIRLPGSRPR